jgi:signal transduction histidine kinase
LFGEFFAVDPAALLGHNFHEFDDHFRRIFAEPATFASRLAGTAADPVQRFTLSPVQRWPEPRELELESTPVHGPAGDFYGRLYVCRDVTREREVDRMKSEFVSLVSHELRTPLTSVKGYIDIVLDGEVGDVPPEQRAFLAVAKRNADRLAALIADILDISRMEAGKLELRLTALELAPVVDEVAASLRPQIEAKGQRLTVDVPPDLPPVLGDPDRVIQILTNLLSNAYKYTPPGGSIAVVAREEGSRLRVEVRDTGVGLTPYEQSRLFTRFFRSRGEIAQEAGGTGLGLAITRQLVLLHGGTIDVTSAPGEGAVFHFTLPLAEGAGDRHQGEPAAPAGAGSDGRTDGGSDGSGRDA